MKREAKTSKTGISSERRRGGGQKGGAAIFAILGLAAIFLFSKYGYVYVTEELNPTLYWAVILILAVVTLFSFGCTLHMAVLGDKPSKKLRRELMSRSKDLEQFLNDSKTKLKFFEEIMAERSAIMTRKGVDCLSMLKKIVGALDKRLVEIKKLSNSRNHVDLIDADELYRRRLIVIENCLDTLIDSDPIPALPPYEWEPTILRLTAEIESELRGLKLVA